MDAVTTGQTDALPRLAQRAYAAGVSREELLTAVEISRFLVDLPAPVLAQAYAMVSA
jgi:alkylhydroperoxidase/carboxymuconolactone decarboxylase family protein YurZ